MAQAFSDNDNSFNTIDSFNNNDNSLSNNDNSLNTNSFNTTIFNYTTADEKSEIMAWLPPPEPQVRHREIGSQRIDTIGAWLLETEEFKRWYSGNGEDGPHYPTPFCEGNPGAGKSYIV